MGTSSIAESPGSKHDGGKVRTDLYSVLAYLGTCAVLTFGVKKYDAWNWSKGIQFMRVYGALLRHLFEWVRGNEIDPETGLPHLDHAGCCIMFLQHYSKEPEKYAEFDDRPYKNKAVFVPGKLSDAAKELIKVHLKSPGGICVYEKPTERRWWRLMY